MIERARGVSPLAAALAALNLELFAESAAAQSAAAFYKGKTVIVAIGAKVGGTIDLNGRQNVPGASSLKLANHLAAGAPTDGTYFAGLNRSACARMSSSPSKKAARSC